MKIISNLTYNTALDLIATQQRVLEQKTAEIERLKEQIDNLHQIIKLQQTTVLTANADNIDFPNTNERGFNDSNIFLL